METAALLIYIGYLGLAFGMRSVVQRRATGSTGFKGISGRIGSIEWLAGVLFVLALVAGFMAPVLALADVVEAPDYLTRPPLQAVGVVLALAGTALTLVAQFAMGESWRIGVDQDERTDLVTTGPFELVRNPIFAAMTPTAAGLVLMVPSILALAALIALVIALQLQVRIVEEPYLLRVHGSEYAGYAARVGRFFPGIGRLRQAEATRR